MHLDPPHPDPERQLHHPARILSILSLCALAFALAQTMVVPALTTLQRELGTDASGATWTITAYLLSAAVFTPVVGRLGDMFGKRRMLIVALAAFTVGSAVSAIGSSLGVVVSGRVLQGVGGGIFPLCFAIARDELPSEKVAVGIGAISAVLSVGGTLGLVLGGLLLDHASYHWIFWVGAILGVAGTAGAYLAVPESPVRVPGKVDVRGALVFGVGIVIPLLAISKANDWGWGSARVVGMILGGLAILAAWVLLQSRTAEPIAHVPTLRRPAVLFTNLATVLVGFGMFGSFVVLPQLLQSPEATGYGFGLDATTSGLVMVPGGLISMFAAPLSGRMGAKVGSHVPLAIGGALSAAGLLMLAELHGSIGLIIVGFAVSSVGIGLAFAAMPNLIVDAVSAARTGEATGFNTVMRSVGSSLGSQLVVTVLTGSAIAGSPLPTDGGYTDAFAMLAGVTLVAGVVAALVPRMAARGDRRTAAREAAGAAGR
ncbi:MFS transporter [Patulibacter sp. SYSU D01012]|uniref:MFS transporter n=1 Tax=Patulibacter sp. SYSU D01012 TaxID=2817381 RepID=UPI001FF04D83|nr:MFS transporter [Patulibacter sp. SYSU D01012]